MEDKNIWCVYIHTSPSKKAYIGITSRKPEQRWENGKGYFKKDKNGNYHQPIMANAIKKYGWENFNHIIFAENLTKRQAEDMERLLIALWQTNNSQFGYNIREGGGSTGKISETTKEKIKDALTGRHPSDETRKKLSEARKGRALTNESKQKMSESKKGENNPMYGKHHTEETRRKISETNKKRFSNPENHPNYGKHPSEETRKKLSEAKLGQPAWNRKAVYCIELDRQWDSRLAAEKETGISHISRAASGEQKYAGRHPITGEPLHWIFI